MNLFQFRLARQWRRSLIGWFSIVALVLALPTFVAWHFATTFYTITFFIACTLLLLFVASVTAVLMLFLPDWFRQRDRLRVFDNLKKSRPFVEILKDAYPRPQLEQFLGGDAAFDQQVLQLTQDGRTIRIGDQTVALFLPISFLCWAMEPIGDGNLENYVSADMSYVFAPIAEVAFPRLEIRREGFFDRAKAIVGLEDINFESQQFSARYHVKSTDRRFAFDIVTPRLMELMLASHNASILIASHGVVILSGLRVWDEAEFTSGMAFCRSVMDAIPAYVWERYKVPGAKPVEPAPPLSEILGKPPLAPKDEGPPRAEQFF